MTFSAAVEAHLAWTVNFRQAIRNRQLPPPHEVADPFGCPLGRWLKEVAHPRFGHLPALQHCLHHHAEFHREALRLADVVRAGDHARAEAMLAPHAPYTLASGNLMVALERLRQEAIGHAAGLQSRQASPVRPPARG